ncbi:MAG: hypothetical protein NT080_14630 [Spirochaetes bacterium]|nr:hypothetical protein [Spirochaetota bacterium]
MKRVAVLAFTALLASTVAAESGDRVRLSPEPGRYSDDVVVVATTPEKGVSLEFKWEGADQYDRLDRPLDLTTFPNEERVYRFALRVSADGAILEERNVEYVIDKRPPSGLGISPPPGSYRGDTVIRMQCSGGDRIRYRIIAADIPVGDFVDYDSAAPPALAAPENGVRRYSVVAYAVDDAANAGRPVIRHYFVASGNLEPDGAAVAPSESATIREAALEGVSVQLADLRPGARRVTIKLPAEAKRVLIAVNPLDPSGSLDDFVELVPSRGEVSIEVSAPYLWRKPLQLYYGYRTDDGTLVGGTPVEIRFPFDPMEANSSMPPDPVVSPIPEGEAVVVAWPPFAGDVYYSIDGVEYVRYRAPIFLNGATPGTPIRLRYYGEQPDGMRSDIFESEIVPPRYLRTPQLTGIPAGPVKEAVHLSKDGTGIVRYEQAVGDSMPKSVTTLSPLMAGGLSFEGEAGKRIRYTVRLRAFSDESPKAEGADEYVHAFIVDREAPAAPRVEAMHEDPSEPARRVVKIGGTEGAIYASVSEEGQPEAAFVPCDGQVSIFLPPDRSVRYVVRAYAIDEVGNRSEKMMVLRLFLDRSSVYVADWGKDANPGTSSEPLRSLDKAIASALDRGLRRVCVNGDMIMARDAVLGGDFEILGAYDRTWNQSPDTVHKVIVRSNGIPFSIRNARVVLRGLDFRFEDSGPKGFALCEDAALSVERVSVSGAGGASFTFVSGKRSTMSLTDVSITLSGSMFAAVVDADSSDLVVERVRVTADRSVSYFTGVAAVGSRISFAESRMESFAGSNFIGFMLDGGSAHITRSFIQAQSGTGECTLIRSTSVEASLDSSVFLADWNGAAVLFSQDGGTLSLHHDTVSIRPGTGSAVALRTLRDAKIIAVNCIFGVPGGASTFIDTDISRGASLSPTLLLDGNCLSGIGDLIPGTKLPDGLAAFNGRFAVRKVNFQEAYMTTFGASLKGVPTLGPSSACHGSALPLGSEYSLDFYGVSRLSGQSDGGSDVGAIESSR